MADNDRYRGYDQDRRRDEDWRRGGRGSYGRGADVERRDEDGYIARRGFGNESSGYGRGGDQGEWRREERSRGYGGRRGEADRPSQGYGRGDRFYGSDPGYGSDRRFGGQGRWQGGEGFGSGQRERDFGDSAGYGSGGSARDWRDVMDENRSAPAGYDPGRERGYAGGYGAADYGRTGSSRFGRGSREDDDDRGFFERAGDEVRSWFGDEDAERRRERDMREGRYGEHRGRGPKNYTRSDERIRDDVNDRLTDDPHIDASDIAVSVSDHEVTLSGHVNSRFAKRHAEDIAESVSGVTHVQNNLRVQQPADTTGAGTASDASLGATASAGSTETSPGGTASAAGGRRRSSSTAGT